MGEGAEMFDRAVKQNPEHVQSHGNLALCLAGLGRKAAALASLDRGLEIDPTYEPARNSSSSNPSSARNPKSAPSCVP